MAKTRNKKPPRIEALFDALTFEHSGHIQAKGAFFAAQSHAHRWSLRVTAEVYTNGAVERRNMGLFSREDKIRLHELVKKITPEIKELFSDDEIIKHIWIHAIKH